MEQPVKLSARVEASDGSYDPRLCSDIHDILPEPKCVQPPNYLASLDAAMSLVPEGWRICNFSQHDHTVLRERGEWMCSLYPDGRLDECNRDFDWPRCEHAATPALALCAAALKARGL